MCFDSVTRRDEMETAQLWSCLHYGEEGGSVRVDVVHLVVTNPYLVTEDSQHVWTQNTPQYSITNFCPHHQHPREDDTEAVLNVAMETD